MDINIVDIGISRIKLLGYAVDETLYHGKDEDENLNLQFQHIVAVDIPKNELIFTLRAFYSYSETSDDFRLMDFHVQNVFFIKDFVNYVVDKDNGEKDINLNENAWTIIASLSLSHTRAFMSNSIHDTIYKHFIIPIVNPIEFTKGLLKLKTPNIEEVEKAST